MKTRPITSTQSYSC